MDEKKVTITNTPPEVDHDVVVISRAEYERLQNDSEFLSCLQACGVDNWNGYGDAKQMMDEQE